MKINFDYPPFPGPRFAVYSDDYDGAPDAGYQPHGYGNTKAEALAAFCTDYAEREADHDSPYFLAPEPMSDVEIGDADSLDLEMTIWDTSGPRGYHSPVAVGTYTEGGGIRWERKAHPTPAELRLIVEAIERWEG